MFASIFQGLTALILIFGGSFCCALILSKTSNNRTYRQKALIGLTFGGLAIALSMNAIVIEPLQIPLDANIGPLLFAGYLGGPIGALITAAFSATFQTIQGEPFSTLGIFMSFAIPIVGALVGRLSCAPSWPVIPRIALGYLLLGYAVLNIVFVVLNNSTAVLPNQSHFSILASLAITSTGIVSTLLTWKILNYAMNFSFKAARSEKLAKRLNLTLQHSGMGIFEREVGNPEVHFDAGIMSIHGLDLEPGWVPASTWEPMVHPEDLPNLQLNIQKAVSGQPFPDWIDYRIIRHDGALRHIRSYWTAERDANGKVTHIIGLQSDLTDTRQTEQTHQASIERLALIAENMPGVLFQTDLTDFANPELKFVSSKCLAIWGYTDTELYADINLLTEAHDPKDRPVLAAIVAKGIATGETVAHRFQITARDGQLRWVDYHGSSSCINGRVCIEAIIQDVTREVEAHEQVEKEREIAYRAQKSESIGQLTGGIAHDFNNLLAVVLGNLELLSDETGPVQRQNLIDNAITATLRGADLTKSLLAFARKARLTPVSLDLNDVVREAKNWMGRALPESVSVETSLLAGLWPIKADRSSLESALLNLILNARDAMAGQGNLTIETANIRIDEAYIDTTQEEMAAGRYVMLAVSDTGEGIENTNISSIFEPFFTTKPPGSGSGLGLSMIAGFMKQSGGTVQVYTEVGQGTTFKLYFPATARINKDPVKPISTEKLVANDGARILMAEDQPEVRETILTVLERAGYNVTATSSGDHAYTVFEADPTFDLLLTDIVMPGKLQGTHLAKALRQRWPDLPIIFMSGYASEATVHGNGLRPEDIRLMKPVRRAELLAAVAKKLSTQTPESPQ